MEHIIHLAEGIWNEKAIEEMASRSTEKQLLKEYLR